MYFKKISLKKTYIIAFTVFAMWIIFAFFTMGSIIEEQKKYAKLINLSGKQRMLSQKTALICTHYELENKSNNKYKHNIDINSLKNSISEIEKNHAFLMDNLTSNKIRNLYLGDYNLDGTTQSYVKHLKNFILQPSTENLYLILDESRLLLKKSNKAVNTFQYESDEIINLYKQRKLVILIGTFVTLILEAFFIFWPLINKLIKYNEELEKEVKARTKDLIIFNKIFENTKDGMVITDSKEIILNVNKAFTDITGYSKEEVLGETPRILQSDKQDEKYYKDMWDSLSKTDIWEGEIINKGKNGHYIYEHLTIIKLIDEDTKDVNFVSIFSNITERIKLINSLEYQKKQSQNYLDIAQVLILILDNNKNVIMINQTGADLLGYKKEEIIGKNWMENFIPKRLIKDVNEVGDNLLKKTKPKSVYENAVLTKSGEERILLWRNSALEDENGKAIGILTSGTDITDEKEKQRQLLFNNKHAQMGEMLSIIAHQWRQPLASISATVINMKLQYELGNNEYDMQELDNIENITMHLSKTIDDFREFFKEEKVAKTTTLEDIIVKALNIIKPSLDLKTIKVHTNFNCNKELSTFSNELIQVILTLLKNSQEVIENKNIQDACIEIETYFKDNNYYIEVKDSAGGIPEKIIDKIFDPYFTTKSNFNGTGLGLYMSKTIVEEHCGGKIRATNKNDGACFIIKL